MRNLLLGLLIAGATLGAVAQDLKTMPLNRLIDNPTAGILQRGHFDFDMALYSQGGVLLSFSVGLLERMNMGASYGGTYIISDQKPEWNQRPELSLKYRLFDESVTWPAVVLGYSGQGRGLWIDENSMDLNGDGTTDKHPARYEVKAKGFFAVAGKNFILGNLGLLGLHMGANINPVENDDDRGLNLWLGMDKEINNELTAVAEYDFAFDDAKTGLSKNMGFLNLGLRWTFAERLSIELDFKDVFQNREDLTGRSVNSVSREIKITYIEFL